MKNKTEQEEVKLNNFLQDFSVKKEAKEQELLKCNQLTQIKKNDFNLVEEILKSNISKHKEGKQDCDQIINIIGTYANTNF